MQKSSYDDGHLIRKIYRYKSRRRPYKKQWFRKKASDKKGFTRYSTGPKWAGNYDPDKPAYWRTRQRKNWPEPKPDEIIPSGGYTYNQTWVALCKSWNGFLIAKREYNYDDIKRYMGQIRKLQKDLGFEQTEFEGYSPAELATIDLENNEEYIMERYRSTV